MAEELNTNIETNTNTAAPATGAAATAGTQTTVTVATYVAPSDKTTILSTMEDKAAVKKIHSELGGIRTFHDSLEKAATVFSKAADKTNNFSGLPQVIADAEKFEGKRVCIQTLGVRTGKVNGIKAIMLFPLPTVQDVLSDESAEAKEFVAKLINREMADTVFGRFRGENVTTAELESAMQGIPLTVKDIVSSSAQNAIDTSVFDLWWPIFRAAFVKEKPAFDKYLPGGRIDPMKAFRSASYAAQAPRTKALEEKKDENGLSMWDKLGAMFVETMKNATDDKTGENLDVDTSVIEGWLAGRSSFTLAYNDGETGALPDALVL